MGDTIEVLKLVVDVVAERNAAVKQRDAARAEVERLRADMREAVTTLHTLRLGVATSMPGYGTYKDWDEPCEADFQNLRQRMDEAAKLLDKHKEVTRG